VSAGPDAPRSAVRKKLHLLKGYVTGAPIACVWQLSRRCAAHCLICDMQAQHADGEHAGDLALRLLARLDTLGSLILSISGGEPLLRPDLPELVERAAQRHFVEITTHGGLVAPEKLRRLWQAGLRRLNVLLHDADPVRHDAVSGIPGSYERARNAWTLAAAQRTSQSQRVNVILRLSGHDLAPLERLLERVAAGGVSLTIEPEGAAVAENADAWAGFGQRLVLLKARHGALRNTPSFLIRVEEALTRGVPGCLMGRVGLLVDPLGRVSRCAERQTPTDWVGNLAEDDPAELLRRLRRLQQTEECQRCWRIARGETEELYTLGGAWRAVPRFLRG
jgi:MoaA/NifB/PqqE/SkfB family radical SAM enzyme